MTTEAVKLARINSQDKMVQGVLDVVKNPAVLGFAVLMANHAAYKKGWFTSRDPRTGEADAIRMHDSNALWIMIASALYATNYGKTVIQDNSTPLKDVASLKSLLA